MQHRDGCSKYEDRKSHTVLWGSKGEILLGLLFQLSQLLQFLLNTHTSRGHQKHILWPSSGQIMKSHLKIRIVKKPVLRSIPLQANTHRVNFPLSTLFSCCSPWPLLQGGDTPWFFSTALIQRGKPCHQQVHSSPAPHLPP